ncbi:hypothetical protein K461DRAFT_325199 [Myriangium duriaei CBS 260.36]|uniref:Uncharacterized protein n=1 Tax=Myriangium duriaei CBS 260.36 TaxID=1168546 RepID=A0A9P4ISM5_9PEZI|nr:hypothetical protein K461DRAFT_325199 [Myriangium duriaei CBS 260.36]
MAIDNTLDASSPSNPSNLPPRYQIRKLTPDHLIWASAIVAHSNMFHSTVFTKVYPDGKTARFNHAMREMTYLVEHQIASGLSYGVFDLEFPYRHASSRSAGGAFLHDLSNDSATGEELIEAMDFPLVSVALAYDGIDHLDMARMKPIMAAIPVFATVYGALEARDPRGESWKAQERTEVLMRNATSTRADYEKRGLMGKLARFLMREAKLKGYKAINIECLNDAVTHVWSHPKQEGMKGEVVCSFWTQEYEEEDEEGNKVNPFSPAEQLVTRCWTTLGN